jgi:hypothetical protein
MITSEFLAEYMLPADLKDRWPTANLSGDVVETSVETSDAIDAKRIRLELSLSEEDRARPLSLSAWVYRPRGQEAQ